MYTPAAMTRWRTCKLYYMISTCPKAMDLNENDLPAMNDVNIS
jgi:hypothetical protein